MSARALQRFHKLLIVLATPLIFLPLPLCLPTSEAKCAYGLLIMAMYWVTEALPLPVTSLLPMVLFPAMGVVKAKVLSKEYFKDTVMLFIGGLLVAVAVERWKLHNRIALRVLQFVGVDAKWLMLGFMLPTWFLSMWISNTATTAMMVPIVQAVLGELEKQRTPTKRCTLPANVEIEMAGIAVNQNSEHWPAVTEPNNRKVSVNLITEAEEARTSDSPENSGLSGIRKGMTLSVAYAATSGGMATLIGTGTNVVLKGQIDEIFTEKSGVDFLTWFTFALPVSVLVLIIGWVWLQLWFLGPRNSIFACKRYWTSLERDATRAVLRNEYDKLGPMTFAEYGVLLHFSVLAILWFSRSGWGRIFPEGYITDSWPAMMVALSLFIFPSERPDICKPNITGRCSPKPPLMTWPTAAVKLPWGVVILVGGGFALAKTCEISGLSVWVGEKLSIVSEWPTWSIVLLVSVTLAMLTEVTSNVAIATIFLPVLAKMAVGLGIHPFYLLFPGALACSFAFMLPVATPPNAIVFSFGHIKGADMARAGIVMNIIAIGIVNLSIHTWGRALFDLDTFPDWANITMQTDSPALTACLEGIVTIRNNSNVI